MMLWVVNALVALVADTIVADDLVDDVLVDDALAADIDDEVE